MNLLYGSLLILKYIGVSDWFTNWTLSYTDEFLRQGLKVILLDGNIFIIGKNGKDELLNEWPTHRIIPDRGGKT